MRELIGGEQVPAAGGPDERRPVLFALMLTMGLAALDSTIVATAIPSIVRDLGGFSQFPWVFSIYLLTQAVTVPLYGRLSDLFGRKPMLFVGIALFLAGSVLCGAAWNMGALILFRGLQGLGAGAVQPITTTVVGDLYDVVERAKVQGYIASVWGISSVVGPALGGLLSQYASWRWIFYLNIPVGLFAAVLLQRHLHESVTRRRHRIDYLGATVLTAGLAVLISGLLQGGVRWPWTSGREIAALACGAVLLVAFVLIERRVPEPVLPPWVFTRRTLAAGNVAGVALGAIVIGLSSYVPTYAQGVLGVGPVVAGFTLAAMSVGWPLASSYAGRIYLRIGFRNTASLGGMLCVVGALLFVLLREDSAVGAIALSSFVVGVGLGFGSTSIVVAIQSIVGWERRGVVTGANMFSRSMGSAVGVAVFGSIANSTLAELFRSPPAAVAGHIPHTVDTAKLVLGGPASLRDPVAVAYVRHGLYLATHRIFIAVVVVAVACLVAELCIPRRVEALVFDEV